MSQISRKTPPYPDLSRFGLQVLRKLWALREGTVREIHRELADPPSYSTVRTLVERLEAKGAVTRARLEGKAWVYRPAVSQSGMIRKEIRYFLDSLFDGATGPLMSHLADMDELTLEDLREIERRLSPRKRPRE